MLFTFLGRVPGYILASLLSFVAKLSDIYNIQECVLESHDMVFAAELAKNCEI